MADGVCSEIEDIAFCRNGNHGDLVHSKIVPSMRRKRWPFGCISQLSTAGGMNILKAPRPLRRDVRRNGWTIFWEGCERIQPSWPAGGSSTSL
jgi:hypothetical protein